MKSADEVIKEIGEIIDAADDEEEAAEAAEAAAAASGSGVGDSVEALSIGQTGSYLPNMMPMSSRRVRSLYTFHKFILYVHKQILLFQVLSQALQGRNLEELSLNELTQILSDIELLVRELSEELVSDLGEQFQISSPSRPM